MLPKHLKPDDIKQGEVEIPDMLSSFLSNLIRGPHVSKHSKRVERRVSSFFCGKWKYFKHNAWLVRVRARSSRKVIDILSNFGHVLSYSALEGIETELCYSVIETSKSTLMPCAMSTEPA